MLYYFVNDVPLIVESRKMIIRWYNSAPFIQIIFIRNEREMIIKKKLTNFYHMKSYISNITYLTLDGFR